MNPVSAISTYSKLGGVQQPSGNEATKQAAGTKQTFGDLVRGFVEQTNGDQVASESAIEDLVTGKTDNIQQVVLAVANAEMSFQLFMEIRNKLIDSYNEIMRMQF